MQRFIYGTSDAVEAEYSYRAREAFTVLELYDDEPVSVDGYHTRTAMLAWLQEVRDAVKAGACDVSLEFVGR